MPRMTDCLNCGKRIREPEMYCADCRSSMAPEQQQKWAEFTQMTKATRQWVRANQPRGRWAREYTDQSLGGLARELVELLGNLLGVLLVLGVVIGIPVAIILLLVL